MSVNTFLGACCVSAVLLLLLLYIVLLLLSLLDLPFSEPRPTACFFRGRLSVFFATGLDLPFSDSDLPFCVSDVPSSGSSAWTTLLYLIPNIFSALVTDTTLPYGVRLLV